MARLLAGNHAGNNVSDGLVVGAVSGAQIEGNTLTGNGDTGLFMFDLLNSRVSANHAGGNGVGIDLEGGQNGSTGNRIANNDTSQNVHAGFVVGGGANDNQLSPTCPMRTRALPVTAAASSSSP